MTAAERKARWKARHRNGTSNAGAKRSARRRFDTAALASARPPSAPPATLAEAVARARDLTGRLMDELGAVTAHLDALTLEILAETEGDNSGARRTAMMRAIGLPSRSLTLKALTGAMREWAAIERAGTGPKAEAGACGPASPGNPWSLLDDDPSGTVN
jgi:hypothetical protein